MVLRRSRPGVLETSIRNPPNALQEDPDIEENIKYRTTPGSEITERQWSDCASLHTRNNRNWSQRTTPVWGSWAVPERNIQVNEQELKDQMSPGGACNLLITAVTGDGRQVGHCFVSQWKHHGDRIWWIVQPEVEPEYRSNKRTTRMLQSLSLHYDIGKDPNQRDFVGVLSCHPFTICAVLRVFGRGLESLPSKDDWERQPFAYENVPLQRSQCAPLLKSSPIGFVRNARIHPHLPLAHTSSFLDHTIPDQALRTLSYAMNKHTRQPWQWLFGTLAEGCEYLCVLKYRFDPEYDMRPHLRSEMFEFVTEQSKYGLQKVPNGILNSIDYAQLDQFLVHHLHSESQVGQHTKMNECRMRALEILARDPELPALTMDAKRIPVGVWPLYSKLLGLGSGCMEHLLSDRGLTWLELKEWAAEMLEDNSDMHTRLLLLQAVHFTELSDEHVALGKLSLSDEDDETGLAYGQHGTQERAGRYGMPLDIVTSRPKRKTHRSSLFLAQLGRSRSKEALESSRRMRWSF